MSEAVSLDADRREEAEYDAGDPVKVEKRKKKHVLRREKELAELKAMLEEKPMRDFVWRLLEYGQLFGAIQNDQMDTFRSLGRRDVSLMVMGEIFEADPAAYTQMRVEHPDKK